MYKPTPEQYIWDVNFKSNFYPREMNMSFEQLEKIYQYEAFASIAIRKGNHFSDFEDWEHERMVFRGFLTDEQFSIYVSNLDQRVRQFQASLAERDLKALEEVAAYETQVSAYRNAVATFFGETGGNASAVLNANKLAYL